MDSFDGELEFISGRIFDIDLPKEQQFLYRYFTTARQRMFVKYYLTYRSYTRFVDHTGFACSKKWLKKLRKRLLRLQRVYQKAKEEGNQREIAQLESGQYPLD